MIGHMISIGSVAQSSSMPRAAENDATANMTNAAAQAAGHHPDIGLTGGGKADAVHREIARMAPASGVDWGAVQFFFGDERFVAADSPDRNVVQARAAFLDEVGAFRVVEVPASDEVATVEDAATAYAERVRDEGTGNFDVLMLGVGPDGHIASLFPGHSALDTTDAITVAVADSPKPPPERVSLTFEALNRARCVWFLVSGEAKAEAVARALADVQGADAADALASAPVTQATPAAGEGAQRDFLDYREYEARLDALAWWDWSHEKLHQALPDFRKLPIEAFLEKYQS